MAYIFTSDEFTRRALRVANEFKTIYAKGCFGWPMIPVNKRRAIGSYAYNAAPARQKVINAADADTFAFDCNCLIKALLWEWTGDAGKIYGGAEYKSNGVPDFTTEQMLDYCTHVSDDFTKIIPGCVLHNPGHVGIYIGDGLAVECTARWKDGVQITNVDNLGISSVCNGRTWQEHGRLQWIHYKEPEPSPAPVKLPTYELHVDQVRKGSTGPSVMLLQRLLNTWLGEGYELDEDGIAGNKTISSLMAYQDSHKLESDGICGTKTWSSILGIEVKMDEIVTDRKEDG